MSKNSESGNVGLGSVARLIRIELQTQQEVRGDSFVSVARVAELIDAVPALVERVARTMPEVDLATALTIRKEHDPEFPLEMRGKKEAEGHWPGIRIVTAEERDRRILLSKRREKAALYIMSALARAGVGDSKVTVDTVSGEVTVTIADGVDAALKALQAQAQGEGEV
jgi:hypothetical protein